MVNIPFFRPQNVAILSNPNYILRIFKDFQNWSDTQSEACSHNIPLFIREIIALMVFS
jgi:hypothetical protein